MATTPNSIITPQTLNVSTVQFTSANGTSTLDLFVAGSNGSIVHAISVAGNHTTLRLLTLKIYDGSNTRTIGALNIPVSSGTTNAAAAVAPMLSTNLSWLPKDVNGNPYIILKSGQKLQVVLDANTDSGTTIDICCMGEDY